MMDAEDIAEWYHATIMEMEKIQTIKVLNGLLRGAEQIRYHLLEERAKVLKAVMENDRVFT